MGSRVKFDIEDAVGSGAYVFHVMGEGVLGVVIEGDFAGLGGARGSPVFVLDLRQSHRVAEMDEDCVVGVGVVGGGVPGVDAYVHDFDVLVFEENVMVGFEVDLQRVGWGAASDRDGGCEVVGVFEFDLDGVGWSVVEVFDGVLFGLAPSHGARGARAFGRCAVGGNSMHVKVGQADGDFGGMLVHGEFLVGLIVDAEDSDAVVLEFDLGDGGVDGDGVLGGSGGSDEG